MAVIAVTALAVAVGVSERRRAEQALDQLNQMLERRIQDRTSVLQANVEQLQELNRLKNAFVGIVSHELRTPLTSMKALTENLLDGHGRSAQRTATSLSLSYRAECRPTHRHAQ